MNLALRSIVILPLLLALIPIRADGPGKTTRTENIVMTDGLRWQEVFGGADEALMNLENNLQDILGKRSSR